MRAMRKYQVESWKNLTIRTFHAQPLAAAMAPAQTRETYQQWQQQQKQLEQTQLEQLQRMPQSEFEAFADDHLGPAIPLDLPSGSTINVTASEINGGTTMTDISYPFV